MLCILEQSTNKISHPNINTLKGVWAKIFKDIVVKSCVASQENFEDVIENNGSHII